MGKKLLVVSDMQNDFVYGSLGTKEAVSILPKVIEKIKLYQNNDDSIIFTQDTHFEPYAETQEGKYLPIVHCIKGSKGWQICDPIKATAPLFKYTVYEKVTFGSSTFANDLSSGRYSDVESVEFVGICTDLSILSNALLVKTFLPEVPIIVDKKCCCGITPESNHNALEVMKLSQILVENDD